MTNPSNVRMIRVLAFGILVVATTSRAQTRRSAELVAVKYPSEGGGYTPGDTWELYVGKDNRVEYFVYHRGGAKKPSLLFATWGGQKKAGPLLLSTDHRGYADGMPIRVWFSDVTVKVTGSDKWMPAQ
jgi:hypothetical protein